MKEKTKEDLKITSIIMLVCLIIGICIAIFFGISYLINIHWAFSFLLIPYLFGVFYLLIKSSGIGEIGKI